MTRLLLLLGVLFATTVSTSSPPALASRNTAAQAVGGSDDCLRDYWRCSFDTDRPAGEPDCFEQYMTCLQVGVW